MIAVDHHRGWTSSISRCTLCVLAGSCCHVVTQIRRVAWVVKLFWNTVMTMSVNTTAATANLIQLLRELSLPRFFSSQPWWAIALFTRVESRAGPRSMSDEHAWGGPT